MKTTIVLILVYALFASASDPRLTKTINPSDPENDFVLVKESGGIALYEKWNQIGKNEKAREIKAVFHVQADVNSIRSLLQHEPSGTQWNKNSAEYKILKQNDNWICYILYDLPWPVSNQDCVLRFTEVSGQGVQTFEFSSIDHHSFPVSADATRIEAVRGKWVLIKSSDGVKVEYYISSKPNKSLPRWITDPIIRGNLIKGLKEFRELLANDNP